MNKFKAAFATGMMFACLASGGVVRAMPLSDQTVAEAAETVLFGSTEASSAALRLLAARGEADIVPSLILSLRFRRNDSDILGTIST